MVGTIGADSVVSRTVNTDVGSDKQVASEVSSPAPLATSRNIWRTDASGNALDASSSLGEQLDTTLAVPTGGDKYYFATSDVKLTNEEYLSVLRHSAPANCGMMQLQLPHFEHSQAIWCYTIRGVSRWP